MRVEIVVPQIGEAISELQIVAWLKNVGDSITKGEVLFEVDSDKAIVEVEAFVNGTLIEILQGEGSAVMPQDVVAVIETADEIETADQTQNIPSASGSELAAGEKSDGATNGRHISPLAERIANDLDVNLAEVQGSGPRGRIVVDDVYRHSRETTGATPTLSQSTPINASPKARRVARERGVDLRGVAGSGIGGMVIVKDVEAMISEAEQVSSRATLPLSKLRQTVAIRTTEAKQTIPHFYLQVDVNMIQVNTLRRYCVEKLGWERAPTYTDIFVRATAIALADLTWANVSYVDGKLVQRERINIGIAVGTDEGLRVPTLPDADRLTLEDTSKSLRELIQRSRTGRLKPGDIAEKSMVISNLGMYRVDRFIAIIDKPDPMILAVGQVAERVVAVNGQVVVQSMCTMTLSVDHRALDGVQGAQILERITDCLEYPYQIMGSG